MPVAFDPTRHRPRGVWQTDHAAWSPTGDLIVQIGYGDVPVKSPYQAGDWVRQHGYDGYAPGMRVWGWRGYVLGGMGGTLLTGVTDDGRTWVDHWGWLDPDRPTKRQPVEGCTCCPNPKRFGPKPRPRPVVTQLDLFDATAVVGHG